MKDKIMDDLEKGQHWYIKNIDEKYNSLETISILDVTEKTVSYSSWG